jgi:imidazolonepropionase-like amidohydrolase
MRRRSFGLSVCLAVAGCAADSTVVAYTGATVWDGTGAPPMAEATLLVDGGRIVEVGVGVEPPRGATVVPLDGKWVIPGLVVAHGHVTGAWAGEEVADPVERVRGDLLLYAQYGVTTVTSLGDDAPTLAARDAATPTDGRARVLVSGPVVAAADSAGARAAALANADAGVDWLKLRVDDELGTVAKMPWPAVAAVMQVGRERDLRVATHLFYLEDARRLLELGTGLLAHSVRDTDVDAAFIDQLRASGVCYVPTLVRDVSTFVYAERPDWFDDPFFVAHANRSQVERASAPDFMAAMRDSPAAAAYRVALAQAQRNLKALSDAGIPIAFGTDSGPATRFPGYFEHMELQLMVDAGLTPEQALLSATQVAARCVGATEVGTLEPGKWADFLVLGADPLRDVRATRRLEQVYVGGTAVTRAGEGAP